MIKKLFTKKNTHYVNRSLKKGAKQHISRKARVSRMRKNVSQKTRKHHHRGGSKNPQSIRLSKASISGPTLTSTSIIPPKVAQLSNPISNPLIGNKSKADTTLANLQKEYSKVAPYKDFINKIILDNCNLKKISKCEDLIKSGKVSDISNRYKLVLQYIMDDDTRANMTTETPELVAVKAERLIKLIIDTLNTTQTEHEAAAMLETYNKSKGTYSSF